MDFDGFCKSSTSETKEDQHDNVAGIEAVFIFLDNALIPYSFSLIERCSNNIEKYKASSPASS